jgi:ketosteroid isomerase-like protein
MSRRNVEAVLHGIEALNRRDADAFVETASPDIEWEDSVFWSEHARIYRGEAELREWFDRVVLEPWESIHFELAEITEAGDDRVFFGGLLTTRGKGSGAETQVRGWSVVWITNGKITRRLVFLDRAEALEAAGLEE